MLGGQVSLARREPFCTANRMEIAAMAGQKILFSRRASAAFSIACESEGVKKINNGATIEAKTHAKIGTIAYLSSRGMGNLGRANSQEPTEAFDILAVYSGPRLITLDHMTA